MTIFIEIQASPPLMTFRRLVIGPEDQAAILCALCVFLACKLSLDDDVPLSCRELLSRARKLAPASSGLAPLDALQACYFSAEADAAALCSLFRCTCSGSVRHAAWEVFYPLHERRLLNEKEIYATDAALHSILAAVLLSLPPRMRNLQCLSTAGVPACLCALALRLTSEELQ